MIQFYFDDDSGEVPVLEGLERLGISAIRTIEAGTAGWSDLQHLAFAASAGRVLVSANRRDFFAPHRDHLTAGRHHAGIVIADQSLGIGERVRRLERLAAALSVDEMRDRIEFLSHWGEIRLLD